MKTNEYLIRGLVDEEGEHNGYTEIFKVQTNMIVLTESMSKSYKQVMSGLMDAFIQAIPEDNKE